jgi:dihydroflavonol-4-reductase
MATIGIIGGIDFLGCDITLKFLSENYRVKILVLPSEIPGSRLVHTGIVAGENLLIYYFSLQNHQQLVKFLGDCDFLVHCGTPYELPLEAAEEPVYVPLISGTGYLLRAMKKVSSLKKVIFVTSVWPANFMEFDLNKNTTRLTNNGTKGNSRVIREALFHSRQITNNLLEGFNSTNSGLLVVSPVTVKNNMLMNTVNATLNGIRYLLRNHIDHDIVFHEIIRRIMFETMINVQDLPDKIFDSFMIPEKVEASSRLFKK